MDIDQPGRGPEKETRLKNGSGLVVAAVGDAWAGGWRRLSVFDEPEYMKLVDTMRAADVGYVNMETSFLDDKNDSPYFDGGKGDEGEYHSAHPVLARDLRWMGFNICSCAMNHSYDYGYEGILSTIRVLDEAGFAHAGIGRDLDHATFPGFLQTPQGTVAIVSAYAGDDYPFQLALNPTASGSLGKPGVNGVRVDFLLDPTTWESLHSTFQSLGLRANNYPWLNEEFGGETLELKGHYYFVKGNEPGTYVRTQPRKQDLDRNIRAVREAAGMADWVIFACHYHTPSTRFDEHGNPNPTEAVEILAKACLDAGADVVIGTGGGGGAYQGIEFYGRKPIFWNMGVFIENVESMLRQPATIYEMMGLDQNTPINELHDRLNERIWKRADIVPSALYWSGLLATFELVGGQHADRHVKEIKLYPCDLHGDMPRAIRGRPTLAREEVASAVFEKLKYKSAQYGTEIDIEGGVGIVRM